MTKVGELAEILVHEQGPDVGKSVVNPMQISVLPDRKTSVFFNFSIPYAFGNVFKFSDLLVLKAKGGNLLTPDILRAKASRENQVSSELKICQVPADEDLSYIQSAPSGQGADWGTTIRNGVSGFGAYIGLGTPIPELRDMGSLFDRIIGEVQDASKDGFHWTCSCEEPPQFPVPISTQPPTAPQQQPVPTPGIPVPSPAPPSSRTHASPQQMLTPSPPIRPQRSLVRPLVTGVQTPPQQGRIPSSKPPALIVIPKPAPPATPAGPPSPLSPSRPPPSPPSSRPRPVSTVPPPRTPLTSTRQPPARQSGPSRSRPSSPIKPPPTSYTSPAAATSQRPHDLQGKKMRGNAATSLGSEGPEFTTGERKKSDYTHQAGAAAPPPKKGFFGKIGSKIKRLVS